ncbi:MAG: alkaline phosphatase family protein [bacterium]
MRRITRRQFVKEGSIAAGAAALAASGIGSLGSLAAQPAPRRVYIINLDGMPAAYLGAKDEGEPLTPNLDALVREGVSFSKCFAVLPALTATNHVAIVSSASTARSGILGAGGFYAGMDAAGGPDLKLFERKHILAETVYDAIRRRHPGAATAVLSGKNWVADLFQGDPADSPVTVKVNGKDHPEYISPPGPYTWGGPPREGDDRERLRFHVSTPADKAPEGCIGGFLPPAFFPSDDWIADAAVEVIKRHDPLFTYVLLACTDDCGHAYGNFTRGDVCTLANYEAMRSQMRVTDAAVGRLAAFLKESGRWNDSVVVITADHGMSTMEERLQVDFDQLKKFNLQRIFETLKSLGSLSVDVRAVLAQKGFHMRASDGVLRRNPDGVYDTALSEGPNTYLYRVRADIREKVRDALLEWNESTPHKPIWKVLLDEEMRDGVNEHDGLPFRLLCRARRDDPNAEVVWPDLVVFTHPGYMNVIYGDSIRAGKVFVMQKLPIPPGINVGTIPGTHGSYGEQRVPLVIIAPGVAPGTSDSRTVSLLDVLPTVCRLSGLPLPQGAEGTALL